MKLAIIKKSIYVNIWIFCRVVVIVLNLPPRQFHKKPVLHPVAPKKGNAGVRMLAGGLEVSLVHLVRDAHAHRKVVLALSVQGKSMLSLTEDPSPRSLGIVPTLAYEYRHRHSHELPELTST